MSWRFLKPHPLNQWCHPNISTSIARFFSYHQSLPASGSFPISRLFASGGQSIEVSASASVLPKTIQDWFSLGLTGLMSLLSKGPSRVFSSTSIQKYQFFGAQPSLWSNSHLSFPCSSAGKESTCNAGDLGLLAITVHSDFGAQEKIFHSYFFPFYLSWSYRTGYHDLSFFNVGSFKAALSLSSLTLI